MEASGKGVYYLFYKDSKNPKKCHVGIKYPGVDSTPLIVIGGRRSKDIYNYIIQLLDNNGIKYLTVRKDGKIFVKLPLATGLAVSIFLLAVYSTLKPLKYATALEKMILGKMPLMKYFTTMVELAIELSNLHDEGKPHTTQTLDRSSARTVSKMLIQLMDGVAE